MAHTDTLQQCWAIALDMDNEDISDDSNFFDLGGDSVQAIRLAEVAREHHLKLDVETVFTYPDFQNMQENSELVPVVEPASDASSQGQLDAATIQACADICGVGPELVEDIFPTAGVQHDLMEAHIMTGAFLMQVIFEVQGTRDTDLVRKAFDIIRAQNQVLRTRLVKAGSEVLQVALKDPIVWHQATDIKKYTAKDGSMWMGYGQPLVRHAVVQESEKTYVVWTCHHSLMDGWTRRLLLDDLKSYLENPVAFTAKPARPPFKRVVDHLHASNAEEANAFFDSYSAGLPDTKSAFTVPDNYSPSPDHTAREISIDRPTGNAITLSNMAQTAFALAHAQMTGSSGTTLLTVRGSRAISMPGAESIMGPMVATVPIHVALPPEKPVSTVLRDIQDTSTQLLKYDLFAWQRFSASARDLIIFNWFPPGSDLFARVARFSVGNDRASLRVLQEHFPNPHASVPCVVNIYDNGDHLRVSSLFDSNLLDPSLLEKVLDLFTAKLRRICGGQGMSVESLMTCND